MFRMCILAIYLKFCWTLPKIIIIVWQIILATPWTVHKSLIKLYKKLLSCIFQYFILWKLCTDLFESQCLAQLTTHSCPSVHCSPSSFHRSLSTALFSRTWLVVPVHRRPLAVSSWLYRDHSSSAESRPHPIRHLSSSPSGRELQWTAALRSTGQGWAGSTESERLSGW